MSESILVRAIAAVLSVVICAGIVMVLWNFVFSRAIGIGALDYWASLALVLILRFCSPPRWENT